MFFDDSTAVNDLTPRFAALSGQYPECMPIINYLNNITN